jgi:signal peptidase II
MTSASPDQVSPAPPNRPAIFAAFAVTTALFGALDLWTKHWAFDTLLPGQVKTVVPGFMNFILSENIGAAFGMLPGKIGFFIGVSALAGVFLLYLLWTAAPGSTWRYGVVVGLVGSGVVGNLYDRLRFGRVRDFIDCYVSWEPLAGQLERWFRTAHWPTYNVADAAICVGAGLLLIKLWGDDTRARAAEAAAAAEAGGG